jgi:alpha-1,2-mannosyltransferase
LILIGSTRHSEDREHVEQLQILIDNLNINDNVQFKLNISFEELKTQLNQATIGLHTMCNEYFGIGL